MWKRYLNFCQLITDRTMEEEDMRKNRPAMITESHCVAISAVLIPTILFSSQIPTICCAFLLYGLGTNIYTIPVTIAAVTASAVKFSELIAEFKDYAYGEEND